MQPFAHDLTRQLRTIAVAAEMAKIEMAQCGRNDPLGDFRRRDVGEVTMAAQDALFDAPGPPGILLEQLQIMIGFQQQYIGRPDALDHEVGGVTEVG